MNECSKGAAYLIRQTHLGIALLPSFLKEGAWGQLIPVTMDGGESQTGTKRDVRE